MNQVLYLDEYARLFIYMFKKLHGTVSMHDYYIIVFIIILPPLINRKYNW